MLSIALTLCGVLILATGRVPELLAGKGYRVIGRQARLVGAILALPVPLSLARGALLPSVAGDGAYMIGLAMELVIPLASLAAAVIFSRRSRTPAGA